MKHNAAGGSMSGGPRLSLVTITGHEPRADLSQERSPTVNG